MKAMIKSKNELAEVTLIKYESDSKIIAEYNGVKCTAIFNCFTGLFYVDDVYGIISEI